MTLACIENTLRRPPTARAPPTNSDALIHTTRALPTDPTPLADTIMESLSMLGDQAPWTNTRTHDDPSPPTGIASRVRLPKLTIHPFDGVYALMLRIFETLLRKLL